MPDASLHWSNPRVAVLIHMKSAVVPVAFHRIGSQGTTCARRTVHLAVRFVCKTSIGRVLLLCLCEHLLVQALLKAHISMSINLIDHCGRAPLARASRGRSVLRRTWLILPVVICLFQGLSHANVRVPVVYYRGVCVRLIIRLMVYPTKNVFLTFLRDNCANRTANTTGEDSATTKPAEGET